MIESAPRPLLQTDRFALREATIHDAVEIARVQTESWQTSYRGILPDKILDTIDVAHRAAMRRELLLEGTGLHLVAYDTTRHHLVGFCYASQSVREGPRVAELHEIYFVDQAKRYGLGTQMFAAVASWCHTHRFTTLVLWVLESNLHARRFYEAMGGKPASRLRTAVRGHPVTELSYVWDPVGK